MIEIDNSILLSKVWVGSTKCGSVVYTDNQQAAYRVKCPVGTEGTVVTVKAAAGQYLTLCEVKIMGKLLNTHTHIHLHTHIYIHTHIHT